METHPYVLIFLFLETVLVSGLCPSADFVEEPTKKKCYYFPNVLTNWFEAKAICEKNGAILAKVEDNTDHNFLQQHMQLSRFYWFGMNDHKTENSFVWTDNTPVTVYQWRNDQPNGGSVQNCVTYDGDNLWQDKDCRNRYYSVCELSTFRQALFKAIDTITDVSLLASVQVRSTQTCVMQCLQTIACMYAVVDMSASSENCRLLQREAGGVVLLPPSPTMYYYEFIY
ncbi:C-type lectin domain family 17, member A-like [Gigantopelta aegis]|uniref:C-type lectin domain family 17, member A-like n=1 Tax=Gigantopelta aegis TaxID=1735272 RepID=UPI001B88B6ED|nr:C-type lectin domain family 17, member A-like [Gigantopelta aegis]